MVKYAVLAFLLQAVFLSGQNERISFKHISVTDGLSQGHVNTMLRDSDGFLWIGTQDGLNRFDGYHHRQFFHETGDSNSLSNNFIWTIFEDSKQQLWIGTYGGGLCQFNRETETFRTFHGVPPSPASVPENSVRSLCEFPEGTLHVGTDRGLWHFDLRSENFFPKILSDTLLPPLNSVTALCPLAEKQLLVGTADGLFRYDLDLQVPRPLRFGQSEIPGVTAFETVGNEIWAGGIPGIFRLKYVAQSDSVAVVGRLAPKPLTNENRLANAITALHLDEHGLLWAGSLNGLHRLNGRGLAFPVEATAFTHFGIAEGLSDNQINCLLPVEPGLLWTGTRQGIASWANGPPAFHNLHQKMGAALCSDVVLGMTEDGEGNLWLGTQEGLVRLPSLAGPASALCLTPANTPGMADPYVINVKYAAGEIWATFWRGGAGRLVENGRGKWRFDPIPGLAELTNGAGIHDLLIGSDGTAWLATPNRGVVRWQRQSGELAAFEPNPGNPAAISSPYIFHLLLDGQGALWAGTANGGLCRMDRDAGTFRCYLNDPAQATSLSNNMVLSTFEDSKKRLWACTANGLNLLEGDGRFRRFSKKDGLPNDVIYGMVEDSEGSFWISTNGGLCKMGYGEGRFVAQNFSASDGLQGNEFNQYAFLKTGRDTLCFGGPGGLTFFDPKNIRPYPHPPAVALTDFQLFNRSVPIGGEGDFVLKNAINETAEITLRHDQHFIAFEFAALGYTRPAGNRYAYQLIGLDEDWVPAGGRRFASYPNLPPGEYTFQVKAANHDGVWNENVKSLKIKVLKPWWATWWAYLLYGLAVAGAVIGIIRFRENSIRQLEQAKAGERERFRKRTARDFHDEAGHRITKLALLTEVAKRRPAADAGLLGQMEEDIQALRAGMRDFIWVLDPENDNLFDTLLRLKDFGNGLFEHSPIHFRTQGLEGQLRQIPLNGNERRHILLIFKEAMNNCVKYSGATGAVLSVENSAIVFSDDGKGFDPAAATGNGLRNMRERAGKIGRGIEIFSPEQHGVTIRLLLQKQ